MTRTLSIAVIVCLLGLSGCQSGSALRNIPVTYAFENVRTDAGGTDEWGAIRSILAKRSTTTPKINATNTRTVGSMKIVNYQATLVVPSLKTLDEIQADLEGLAEGKDENDRARFTLVSLSAGYRSNVVAATASTMISGFANPGYRVRVYSIPGEPPEVVTAGRGGIWTAKLNNAPASGWVYGVSEDPEGRDQPAYFRVNVLSRKQERVDAATFGKMFPPNGDAMKATPERSSAEDPSDRSRDAEERAMEAKRKAEDEARRRKIEQEDAARRSRSL